MVSKSSSGKYAPLPHGGKTIYPDPTTPVAGYQAGNYDPATHTITWFHGEAQWNLQTTAQADATLPLTIRSNGRPELNKYVLDYSAYLPAGASLSYTIPHVTSKEFTQTTITSNGAKLSFPDSSEGLLLIGSPTQITYQNMVLTTASSISSVSS